MLLAEANRVGAARYGTTEEKSMCDFFPSSSSAAAPFFSPAGSKAQRQTATASLRLIFPSLSVLCVLCRVPIYVRRPPPAPYVVAYATQQR